MIPFEVEEKMRDCKALKGKSYIDIITSPEYLANLRKYMDAQFCLRRAVLSAMPKGKRAPAHVVDSFMDWTEEQFAVALLEVISGKSELTAQERKYVKQLGMQAYNFTIQQLALKEHPELAEYFKGGQKS